MERTEEFIFKLGTVIAITVIFVIMSIDIDKINADISKINARLTTIEKTIGK